MKTVRDVLEEVLEEGKSSEAGGEGGIRTLDELLTHTPLAGERLQPLGHLSTSFELCRIWIVNVNNPGALGL